MGGPYQMDYAAPVRVALPMVSKVPRAEPRAARLSITDRCDLACLYCRPHRRDGHLPSERRLAPTYWSTVARGLAARGVRWIRITGGEPLVHPDVIAIARAIAAVDGIEDLAITTNGTQLASLAPALRDAGVRRLNLSLDSLDEHRFFRITRGGRLGDVLLGLAAAARAGFELKTNTVVLGGDDGNEHELAAIAELAWAHSATPRFLELMSVGEGARIKGRIVPYARIRARLAHLLVDESAARDQDRGPAVYARALEGRRIGFITGTSDTFCSGCDRLRVSSDGQLRPCLATNDAVDISAAIREGDLAGIGAGLTEAWAVKPGDGWGGCTEASAASVDMRATGG
jgi:GTP 3',8-cyclase